MSSERYRWAARGDVNAFFGLMLDNIAGLVLTVSMLSGIFGFPIDFAIRYMVPGTAIGVLVGDLLFFGLAFALAKRTGRTDVTAMPLGLDTPSTIGMVLFVLGPSYLGGIEAGLSEQEAAMRTWHIGICCIFISGILKGALSVFSERIRSIVPRAGLLGSLAAIALALIAFNQLPKLAADPIVGFASLVIVLATLVARSELPFKIPGALGAVAVGAGIWYLLLGIDNMAGTELAFRAESGELTFFPQEWLTVFNFEWFSALNDALAYMPYVVPFAIATVIGGIDCTESAASVGDKYNTNTVIGIEAFATLVAGVCGGVIQTTPYIGHPAYKAMGGRAAYTLATALFVGGAGIVGYFTMLFNYIPEAAVLPILIFIGIEITAQSFQATPKRHYAPIAIACLPALAKLLVIFLGQYVAPDKMASDAGLLILRALAGGFIISSLIWASAMAKIIDRDFLSAAAYFGIAAVLVLFGIVHSPIDGDKMFWPWNIGMSQLADGTMGIAPELRKLTLEFFAAYVVMGVILLVLHYSTDNKPITTDEEYEALAH